MNVDLAEIEKAVDPILAQEAAELVDLRFLREGGRWVLRFYVEKPGGTTLDDCEYLSNRIGSLLDMREELVPGPYTLEVSSPGLDRVLKKPKDFQRFSGHRAKIRLKAPLAGQRHLRGYLRGMDEERVLLENGPTVLRIGLAEIDEARLDPEIEI
jgi:ribosome maturation factor RimP